VWIVLVLTAVVAVVALVIIGGAQGVRPGW
jgi:hypothetical protein